MYDVSEMNRNPFFTGEASFFSRGIRADSSDKTLLLFEEVNDNHRTRHLAGFSILEEIWIIMILVKKFLRGRQGGQLARLECVGG